jgi:uncharacterized protein YqeY
MDGLAALNGMAVAGPKRLEGNLMATLLDRVNTDIAGAMRAREQTKLDALRMLKTALVNRAVEKARPLDEVESLQVVTTLVKQRKESIEQFTRGGRQDLADKETAEIAVLEAYLPPPIDRAELDRLIAEAVEEAGASGPKDMGRVMKLVMARVAGRSVDGRLVSELVRARLAG